MTKVQDQADPIGMGEATNAPAGRPPGHFTTFEKVLGTSLWLVIGAAAYMFFAQPGAITDEEWQDYTKEMCGRVHWLAQGVIDMRNRGVRDERAMMLQIGASSLEWQPEIKAFLLEMAEDIVQASPAHDDVNLLIFAQRNCEAALEGRRP